MIITQAVVIIFSWNFHHFILHLQAIYSC